MTNMIRLVNGGTVQVRTGVIQGVGPDGPRGLVGPEGPQGPRGDVGPVGPAGSVSQYHARRVIGTAVTIPPSTDTNITWGGTTFDDMGLFTTTANQTFAEAGDYQINVWLRFDLPANAADGFRDAWLVSTANGILARATVPAVVGSQTYVNVCTSTRVVPGEIITVRARSTDDLSVAIGAGAIAVVRIGPGARGETGPQGPQGLVGPAGPAGPPGATGSAGSGFGTYADLLP